MRQETYRFALDEATAELRDIVAQFEALKSRKESIENVVEALRPFIGLQAETPTVEAISPFSVLEPASTASEEPLAVSEAAYSSAEAEEAIAEPQFTFMKITGPGMEVVKSEPAREVEAELVLEPVHVLEDATPEQVAYFRQPSADPFQKRIDDALWGWQQRPEGLLSPI